MAKRKATAATTPEPQSDPSPLPPKGVLFSRVISAQNKLYDIWSKCELIRRSIDPEDDNPLYRVMTEIADDFEREIGQLELLTDPITEDERAEVKA